MYVATANYGSADAAEVFCSSLKKTGFAVLAEHPIDKNLLNEVYSDWQAYFAADDKHDDVFNKQTQDGYFPYLSENAKDNPIKDLKEFYHYYPWGKYPRNVSNKTQLLYQQMNTLAGELLRWIEQYTPTDIRAAFSMPLSDMITDSPRTLLRILHYPPLTGVEAAGSIRAAAHEDINLITLLPAATMTGLQVKDVDNNWHDVDCNPGNIVVNVGDMLQLCSQGYYRSTTHQVTNPEGEIAKLSRLSMPLFLHPCDTVRLSDTHTAKSYLFERLQELGLM